MSIGVEDQVGPWFEVFALVGALPLMTAEDS
jgi:hypothetical protein